ncbi:MAG: hypothetical protein HY323_18560 [Betaproteobacteria bacterium]|nr:hypothetical protein [Betaproteobacteria bacterium]
MKPRIDKTEFGSITIDGETYEHDVLIRPGGKVKKRKKKLSKEVYGTSHVVSLAEAEHVFRKKARKLIIGSGHAGNVRLSDEAKKFFAKRKCEVVIMPTPQAIRLWNDEAEDAIGLFHVTC